MQTANNLSGRPIEKHRVQSILGDKKKLLPNSLDPISVGLVVWVSLTNAKRALTLSRERDLRSVCICHCPRGWTNIQSKKKEKARPWIFHAYLFSPLSFSDTFKGFKEKGGGEKRLASFMCVCALGGVLFGPSSSFSFDKYFFLLLSTRWKKRFFCPFLLILSRKLLLGNKKIYSSPGTLTQISREWKCYIHTTAEERKLLVVFFLLRISQKCTRWVCRKV